jgi:hypothetical protein
MFFISLRVLLIKIQTISLPVGHTEGGLMLKGDAGCVALQRWFSLD